MLEYVLIYMGICFLSIFISISDSKLFKFTISVILITVLSYLYYQRDFSIGVDTYAYVEYFDLLKNSSFVQAVDYARVFKIEVGFFLLSKILIDLFDSSHIVFFIYALFVYSLLIFSFQRYKINFLFSVLSLFTFFPIFFYNFNILRQSIALSLIIFSIYYLFNGRNKSFFSLIFLSSLFHAPSIIAVSFYFIYRFKDFIYRNILGFILVFLAVIIGFFKFASLFLDKYMVYLEADNVVNPFSFYSLSLYFMLLILSVFVLSRHKDQDGNVKFLNLIFLIFLMYNISLYFVGFSNQGLNRIGFYFMWPIIFIIPMFLRLGFSGNNRYLVNILFFIFFGLMFGYILTHQPDSIVPFVSW
ncbi:EpsG family protein [Acinetobacter haemolyticus]|uniref:EpsG family protein n=1 Tax=Acinetobacter haemolyticus TaxID=29430 RepID=UPI001331ECDE|nr:EpsG family protein [Acinetobacter haemolyticus]NAR57754.1 hypothetical protein [Acinetobacter haemolyticus]NAS01969.1 hypothetical protein [Acinetobacter haemolyticus]QHI34096.1 EpsG family protein [Acinetobacter haemolyticus]